MSAPEPISTVAPTLPGRSVASQRWSDLTFVHWRVAASDIQHLFPAGVRPDEHDGSSWVGLIGFFLDRATLAASPPIPYFGEFAEINVRLYGVDESGRRGVVFVSLEASRLAAVLAARMLFSIPYFWSRTSIRQTGDEFSYYSRRFGTRVASQFVIKRRPIPVDSDATADFLTARWGLFTTRWGRTIFLPNWHEPWRLWHADLVSLDDDLVRAAGVDVGGRMPDSVLYGESVTTWFGAPR